MKNGKSVLWFLVGLIAGILDYSLALGYGLVASLLLVVVLGHDPKEVVDIIVTSQLLTLLPASLLHIRSGNVEKLRIPYPLVLFVGMTSVLTLILPCWVVSISPFWRRLSYSLILLVALALLEVRKRRYIRNRYMIPFLALVAALDKVIVGGGLSLIFVVVQTSLNIDLRSAIALTPLLTFLPTLSTTLGYMASLRKLGLQEALFMSVGALASTLVAPKLLRRFKMSENTLKYLLLIASILNLLRLRP